VGARRLLGSLALVAALVSGCATALAPRREPIPPEAQRAVDLLDASWRAFDDLRTLAAITVDRRGDRQQLSGALLARRPGAVRFEALSPMGTPLLLLVVADGQLRGYNTSTNEAVVGRATPEVTAKLLSLPFDANDLVSVLAGLCAPPEDLRAAELLAADSHGPSVMLYGAVNRKRVWMDMATGVIRQQEIVGGRYAVLVAYLRDADGQITAFSFDAANSQVTGTVRYRDPVFGGGVDPARFALTIPPGAQIKTLE
jgi:outer membrane lipoprotein-sorting protein